MWQATVHGSQKSQTLLSMLTHPHASHRRQSGYSPGQNLLELTWASGNESPQFLPLQIAHWKVCRSGSVGEFPLNPWPLRC